MQQPLAGLLAPMPVESLRRARQAPLPLLVPSTGEWAMQDIACRTHPAVSRLGSDPLFIYNYTVAAVYRQPKRRLITTKIVDARGRVIANDQQD